MRIQSTLIGVFLMTGVGSLPADEGRIPISQPLLSTQSVVITSPGSYVLTEDLAIGDVDTGASVIVIQSGDVTLDLNGRTIRVTEGGGTGVLIDDGDYQNIRIRDGRIQGGAFGVRYASSSGFKTSLWLEGLDIRDVSSDGVSLTGIEYFEMTSCKISNTGNGGIYLVGGGTFPSRIVGNHFTDIANNAIIPAGGGGAEIRANVMTRVSSSGVNTGIGAGPILIEGNTMIRDPAGTSPATGIVLASPGCQVVNNVIKGYSVGILAGFSAGGHRIAGNVVTAGVAISGNPGDGISVATARSLIEGNQLEGNAGCGLRLQTGSSGNAYRDNMLRGNAGGAVCNTGTGNTDAGGNVL